ncbi:hypothetical protein QJS04_geneDACA004956 [Acorus gramineus]|uniref:Solute carrier family 25 member 44 n=1 Tax=Acorus gramineus TaxID=55184 RepID=A0AAV9BZ71_ACOGR|nr:hypothetical protein QJS04_geneDACA004956 [Acorus gramineus]
MSLAAVSTEEEKVVAVEEESPSPAAEIHLPADIDWQMLDKSRFFFLGAALFSGVSAALYPVVVLKTRQQICRPHLPCFKTAASIVRHEGFLGFYRGFGTSITGTIPARALYMTALEITKSAVGTFAVRSGVPEPAAATVANAAAGLSAAVAAQLVWTPVDVISQRLMVPDHRYRGGIDAFGKIVRSDGVRGLYRGFGMSILTYAPSNAVWWATYSVTQRLIWGCVGCHRHFCTEGSDGALRPDAKAVVAVQGASAAVAGGMAAVVTMPMDTIKTRMQVMDGGDGAEGRVLSIGRTLKSLLREGGWAACYRGLGPRWASTALSATMMITTYEFLKRMSTKRIEGLG